MQLGKLIKSAVVSEGVSAKAAQPSTDVMTIKSGIKAGAFSVYRM